MIASALSTVPASYQIVFDVTRRGPQCWWLLGIPLVMVAVGVAIYRRSESRIRRGFIAVWTGFAVALGLILAVTIVTEYVELRTALGHGHYRLVEGVVTDFSPADFGDHRPERFAVATPAGRHEYAYSSSSISQGFSQTRPHGGPLRDGMRVRIADVEGKIARLEIMR